MPITILLVGVLLLVTVWRGNTSEVFTQVESDVVGSNGSTGFALWAGAILFLAAAGAILQLEKTAKLFIALVLAVFVIQQKGLWTQAGNALASVQAPPATSTTQTGAAVTALDTPATGTTTTTTGSATTSGSANPSFTSNDVINGVQKSVTLLSSLTKGT